MLSDVECVTLPSSFPDFVVVFVAESDRSVDEYPIEFRIEPLQ